MGRIGDVRFREEVLFNEKGFGVGFGFCKGRLRWWINVGWWWVGRTGCRRLMNGDGSDGSDVWIYCWTWEDGRIRLVIVEGDLDCSKDKPTKDKFD